MQPVFSPHIDVRKVHRLRVDERILHDHEQLAHDAFGTVLVGEADQGVGADHPHELDLAALGRLHHRHDVDRNFVAEMIVVEVPERGEIAHLRFVVRVAIGGVGATRAGLAVAHRRWLAGHQQRPRAGLADGAPQQAHRVHQ